MNDCSVGVCVCKRCGGAVGDARKGSFGMTAVKRYGGRRRTVFPNYFYASTPSTIYEMCLAKVISREEFSMLIICRYTGNGIDDDALYSSRWRFEGDSPPSASEDDGGSSTVGVTTRRLTERRLPCCCHSSKCCTAVAPAWKSRNSQTVNRSVRDDTSSSTADQDQSMVRRKRSPV